MMSQGMFFVVSKLYYVARTIRRLLTATEYEECRKAMGDTPVQSFWRQIREHIPSFWNMIQSLRADLPMVSEHSPAFLNSTLTPS